MTSNRKTDKELAFLQDLFIAPDWGERFAELIDEQLKLPKEERHFTSLREQADTHCASRTRRGQTRTSLCR